MSTQIRFVIVSCPRTGSTHLVDYLASVDRVCCLSEIFRDHEVLLRHGHPIDPEHLDVGLRDADPLGWLERLEREFDDYGWFGFKLFAGPQSTLLRHLCADRSWRKIYLRRDNLLDQYVSFLLAKQHFGSQEWGRAPNDLRLKISPDLVVSDLATIESAYIALEHSLMLATHGDVFSLEYAALGRPPVMRQLLKFLRLPQSAIAEFERRSAGNPALRFEPGPRASERIENYGEIRRILEGTRYRRFAPRAVA